MGRETQKFGHMAPSRFLGITLHPHIRHEIGLCQLLMGKHRRLLSALLPFPLAVGNQNSGAEGGTANSVEMCTGGVPSSLKQPPGVTGPVKEEGYRYGQHHHIERPVVKLHLGGAA